MFVPVRVDIKAVAAILPSTSKAKKARRPNLSYGFDPVARTSCSLLWSSINPPQAYLELPWITHQINRPESHQVALDHHVLID